MKLTTQSKMLLPLLAALCTVALAPVSMAGPRHNPGNPRGVADPVVP
ncbi:hypothetical protein [Verrucomicrobium spinosum]|nr:hypothetical protein [Verrucomicrobium spinosum]